MGEFQDSALSSMTVMGTQLVDVQGVQEMLVRFLINLLMVGVIVQFFYYPKSRRRDYHFTFMMISVSIFMLIYLMEGSKLKVGAALGLFAIFGIIRYRTEAVPIREMTYLFFVVSLSVINGMAAKLSVVELFVANFIFIAMAWLFESNHLVKHVCSKYIRYDNVNLIAPERRADLKADLEKRTGLKIIRLEVGAVDFLKDSALIRIYYEEQNEKSNSMENVLKLPKNYE